MHNASMPSITIRDVPAEVRDGLAARAASEGRSMQQYLLNELTKLASRRTNKEILDAAHERNVRMGVSLTTDQILRALDDDHDRG